MQQKGSFIPSNSMTADCNAPNWLVSPYSPAKKGYEVPVFHRQHVWDVLGSLMMTSLVHSVMVKECWTSAIIQWSYRRSGDQYETESGSKIPWYRYTAVFRDVINSSQLLQKSNSANRLQCFHWFSFP